MPPQERTRNNIKTLMESRWRLLIATIPVLITCIGTVGVIDNRYAHRINVEEQQRELNYKLDIGRLSGEIDVLLLRKATLEDRVYDSVVRSRGRLPVGSPDMLILERYKAELLSIAKTIAHKSELRDQLMVKK